MLPTLDHISNFVEQQFPEFYRVEGQDFIAFVKAYYEWLETEGPSRDLFSTRDIDLTADNFVKYFTTKYLASIPSDIAADKRFLTKHILDLYRSKGSTEGIRLLFRLLYNEEITIYKPSVDIIKASDGIWVQKQYIEVDDDFYKNRLFDQKFITGTRSGASAFVDSYQRLYIQDRVISVFYLTNITGTFEVGEQVYYDITAISDAPYVLGSPVAINILGGTVEQPVGDILVAPEESGRVGLKAAVSDTVDISTGYIDFKLITGGNGYTTNTQFTITKINGAGSGSSANISGVVLSNTSVYSYITTMIAPVVNVALNAASYGVTLNNQNINSVINTAVSISSLTIGTISRLTGINPGTGYTTNVSVTAIDPVMSTFNLPDGSNGTLGNNAVITGDLVFGSDVPRMVRVINSGIGYNENDLTITLYNSANVFKTVTGTIQLGAVGTAEGYWTSSKGFLDSDKYIQDNDYYQEYSYELQLSRSIDKYLQVLKDVMHPTGNKIFGKTNMLVQDADRTRILAANVTQIQS
jgi:hypothetical protein